MTFRGNIPVNCQYLTSNSLHFMHLFKPFKGVMKFAKILKINTSLI